MEVYKSVDLVFEVRKYEGCVEVGVVLEAVAHVLRGGCSEVC